MHEKVKNKLCQLSVLTYFISFERQHLYIRCRHIAL